MYDQYVRYNKLISPVNGYSTKRILMSNIKKFGFDSIDDLHSKYPNFPLFCQETLEKLEYKSKKFSDKKKLSDIENYNISPKSCLNCSNIFTYETRNNKFCNSACSASYNNKKRTNRSVESKIKTSNSLKKFLKKILLRQSKNEIESQNNLLLNFVLVVNKNLKQLPKTNVAHLNVQERIQHIEKL